MTNNMLAINIVCQVMMQMEEKTLEFRGQQPRPLRKGAYLKITWNKNKGVTSYEEVQKEDIPKTAQEKLSKRIEDKWKKSLRFKM